MLDVLHNIDSQLFEVIHNLYRSPAVDSFFWMFTGRWTWVPFYASLAVMIFCIKPWPKALMMIAAIGIAVALTDQTCASIIRPIVARLRPSHPDNPLSAVVTTVNNYRGGNYGFPSCHAGNSFALATFIVLAFKHRVLVATMFTWAIVNSLSRLYLGVHYPGDLIVGAIIGSLIGAACFAAWRAIAPRLPSHFNHHRAPSPSHPLVASARRLPSLVALATTLLIAILAHV